MKLSTINNKIAFCDHKTGVFHFNVLQSLNKLSHIKMRLLALHHPLQKQNINTVQNPLKLADRWRWEFKPAELFS